MNKQVNIHINNREKEDDQVISLVEEEGVSLNSSKSEMNELVEFSEEDLYVKELEIILEEYMKFTKTYKEISKQMLNPFKMKKNAGKIYEDLTKLSLHFNLTIGTFRNQAIPPEDLLDIHEDLLVALDFFETYNSEFPDLMRQGNFRRINEVSHGLDKGHKGIKEVFIALEKRENEKENK